MSAFSQLTGLGRTSWPVSRKKIDIYQRLTALLTTYRELREPYSDPLDISHHIP
jgi:hypothetical protein